MTLEMTRSDDAGRAEMSVNGSNNVLTWFPLGDPNGVELLRFDPAEDILRIFPKVGGRFGLVDQYDHVKEIQIDTSVWPWDATQPLGETDAGEVQLLNLPDGFGRFPSYGLGLPRAYRGLVRSVEEMTSCTVVRFGGTEFEGLSNDVFHISLQRFSRFRKEVDLNRDRAATVAKRVNITTALNEISEITGSARVQPTLGRHPLIQAMTRSITDNVPLDFDEQTALMSRLEVEVNQIVKEQPASLGRLRSNIDLVTLDALIENFENNLSGAGAKSEQLWQNFFRENIFALKQVFAAPLAYFGEQITVRGPDAHGVGEQISDFLLLNSITQTAVLVEIKTPSSSLIAKNPYRGKSSAEVYAPDKQLSGAIAQVQAQMASATQELEGLVRKLSVTQYPDTTVVVGVLVAGTLSSLGKSQMQSFLRYREGLHGVQVVTFDEMRDRLVALKEMMTASHPILP